MLSQFVCFCVEFSLLQSQVLTGSGNYFSFWCRRDRFRSNETHICTFVSICRAKIQVLPRKIRKEESESCLYTYEHLSIPESIPFVKNQSDSVVDTLALIPGFKYNLVLCSEVRYQRQSTKISWFYCLGAISRHSCRADEPHSSFYLRSLDNVPASTRVIRISNPVTVPSTTEVNTD